MAPDFRSREQEYGGETPQAVTDSLDLIAKDSSHAHIHRHGSCHARKLRRPYPKRLALWLHGNIAAASVDSRAALSERWLGSVQKPIQILRLAI
jgi:hypothetical protein